MQVLLNVVRGRETPQALALEAASLDDARRQAEQMGYLVLSARREGAAGWLPFASLRLGVTSQSHAEVPVFVEQLQSLLGAGLSVIEALDTLLRGANPAWQPVLHNLVRQLREGRRLSDCLVVEPAFPELLVALVRSAEMTSDLPVALSRYLAHHQRAAEVRHRIVSVAVYPLLLMGVGSLVMLFLLLYVMPRFARVFEGMQGDLPWSAHAMVAWAHFLQSHGLWLLAALMTLATVGAAAGMTPAGRSALMGRLLRLSWLQQRLRTYFLARWYRTTAMLVEGGIALPQSVSMATQVLPLALRAAGQAVEQSMRTGLAPARSYSRNGMATPVAEQLLLASERTGDVGSALGRIAEFHEAEVYRALENAMRAFEPLVMTFIGIGVGAVVVLMYLPIFELASAIQ